MHWLIIFKTRYFSRLKWGLSCGGILLALLIHCLFIAAFSQKISDFNQRNEQQSNKNSDLMRYLLTANNSDAKNQNETYQATFSVMSLLRQVNGQLVKWMPRGKSAELELLLYWENLPVFFRLITKYEGIHIPRFEVIPTDEKLLLKFALEFLQDA